MNKHLTFILPLIALGGLVAFLIYGSSPRISYSDSDPLLNSAYWSVQFETRDAKEVYEEFKRRNERAPLERQHLATHPIGELIYETQGISGLTICDSSFGFGCYHGFFARAIGEGGVERISELDAICVAVYGPLGTGCQHGIGHGILEYVGYDNVNKALELCGKTTESAPLLGCSSGVFMEYNTPLAGAAEGLVPTQRPVSEATSYEPCTTVPLKYQASCYYQIGEWVSSAAPEPAAKTIQDVCGSLSGSKRDNCYLGVGGIIGFNAAYDVEKSRLMCAAVSGEDDVACNAGVSWSMYATPEHREEAPAACAYADAAREERCLTLADLTNQRTTH